MVLIINFIFYLLSILNFSTTDLNTNYYNNDEKHHIMALYKYQCAEILYF